MPTYSTDHAARVRDLIAEKIAYLSGDKAIDDSFMGLYFTIGLTVPENIVNRAIGATNDFVMRKIPVKIKRAQVRQYFLAVVKEHCEKQRIETGIKHWWTEGER